MVAPGAASEVTPGGVLATSEPLPPGLLVFMALATVLGAVFVSKTQANATLMKELEAELGPGVRGARRAAASQWE